MDDETLTAYHESGHAVIGYALGGKIDSIQLWGEADDSLPERFGDCRVNWGKVSGENDWQRQREIMTVLAGPVAEMIYRGEKLHPAAYGPWQHDWQTAMSIGLQMTRDASKCTRLMESIIVELHRHMQNEPCWPAIASLADELAAHEMLEEEQVAEVLEFWLSR